MPPKFIVKIDKTVIEDFNEIAIRHKKATIWIGGDANLPDIDWHTDTISSNRYPKEINEHFLVNKSELGLTQIVNFPTRDDITLDIFLTNRPNLVQRCVGIPGISDRDTIAYVESWSRAKYQKPTKHMLSGDTTNNPKRFWSFIKGKRTESTGVAPLRKEGILHSHTETKANILNDQFTSVFSSEKGGGEVPTKGDSPYPSVPEINV
ncbi:Hypothetical predicted protein [Mytilus galloprovincialis]|uniref:Endonuclease/exonuclease/phosphatase domain-containing protein n=1 Tax=Mytilus galloprovincialis TaxID=29158 RepID=A0A8B6CU13_MYTGA|nr:Hypothetical predicted protein [Mytilus galloprovincialis]